MNNAHNPTMPDAAPLPDQVKLPLSAALEVVIEGIQIRLGRSLVTLTGVICGMAFLMAMLTGQVIQRGVQVEDSVRAEVARMLNFLRADLGDPAGKAIGVIIAGTPGEAESRLLAALAAAGAARFQTAGLDDAGRRAAAAFAPPVLPAQLGPKLNALIVAGPGALPPLDWQALLGGAQPPLLATTCTNWNVALPAATTVIRLARPLQPDELARLQVAQRRQHFRGIWVVAISLLVTVFGIANAMLMSVTERFREIGTMKCLGALSGFIRQVFLLEASMMGLVGGLGGALAGALFAAGVYSVTYGPRLVAIALGRQPGLLVVFFLGAVVTGVALSILAAVYPARVAARMVPAHALRTNI